MFSYVNNAFLFDEFRQIAKGKAPVDFEFSIQEPTEEEITNVFNSFTEVEKDKIEFWSWVNQSLTNSNSKYHSVISNYYILQSI